MLAAANQCVWAAFHAPLLIAVPAAGKPQRVDHSITVSNLLVHDGEARLALTTFSSCVLHGTRLVSANAMCYVLTASNDMALATTPACAPHTLAPLIYILPSCLLQPYSNEANIGRRFNTFNNTVYSTTGELAMNMVCAHKRFEEECLRSSLYLTYCFVPVQQLRVLPHAVHHHYTQPQIVLLACLSPITPSLCSTSNAVLPHACPLCAG